MEPIYECTRCARNSGCRHNAHGVITHRNDKMLSRTTPLCSKRNLIVSLVACFVILAFCVFQLYQIVRPSLPVTHISADIDALDDYPWKRARQSSQNHFVEDFRPINQRGIYTFWNVCIEAVNGAPLVKKRQLPDEVVEYEETERIVVYDSFFRSGQNSVLTASSVNAFEVRWDIFFTNDEVPSTYDWSPDTAFFISQSCPGNFHHFWNDEFVMLYSLMNISNRLRPEARNHVLYRSPTDLSPSEVDCDDIHKYQDFLPYINVVHPHEVFYKMPSKTCFRNGVFGMANLNYDSKLVVQHVLSKAGISPSECAHLKRVLIVQRRQRRLMNANELLQAAIDEGFPDSVVIDFAVYSVEEQIRLSACSTIMAGIQGAGLQWAIFMPVGSTLIEIAWPQKHWGFYFNSFVTGYGIDHQTLTTDRVHVNWRVYQERVRRGQVVPEEERLDMLHSSPKSIIDNVWKWADALVDVGSFVDTLRAVKTRS
ncbi:hypothetical protein CAPTEDRAFT_191673 [Capitella teleta]|uniref:Glycosyltransferase 61 catalytic domain-containing protein n=1 Tax=Capitella teleta TaxID=283909 RepID=R7VEX8_CAPTE|nr:hypothetical protein CAPTEDRAFT_191673 [Capitella teleta]|eukprot:ELU14205.1 hypothetical protein CAPTEDRAFT_191673 [Capitella teleta]